MKLLTFTNLIHVAIMELLTLYTLYFTKIITSIKTLLTTPAGVLVSLPLIAVPFLTNLQLSFVLLFGLFLADFGTGLLASYFEKKEEEKTNPALKDENLISSEKAKFSVVKALAYTMSALGVYFIEKIFFIKTFRIDSVSEKDLTITLIWVGFCCAIEFYSIFFENFKRMGFDLAKKMTNVGKKIKSLI